MSPKDEFEGKSVDAAVEQACKALRVGREKLKYEVLSYGSTGIFGIVGAKKARIRVKNSVSRKPLAAERKKPASARPVAEESENSGQPSQAKEKGPVQDLRGDKDETRPTLADMEAAAERGKKYLQRIVEAVTDEASIVSELEAESIRYEIHGGNAAVLIGKRGQTLEAIQYLVDKMVNQGGEGRGRIGVDVEGYWENRRSSLEEMARRMAGKSKKTGKPITLGQMNAHDRKIIHLTLKDDLNVET